MYAETGSAVTTGGTTLFADNTAESNGGECRRHSMCFEEILYDTFYDFSNPSMPESSQVQTVIVTRHWTALGRPTPPGNLVSAARGFSRAMLISIQPMNCLIASHRDGVIRIDTAWIILDVGD